MRRNNNRSNNRTNINRINRIIRNNRNNTRRNNEILLNERSNNGQNLNRNFRIDSRINNGIIWNFGDNITNENQKCIICHSDEKDLILSKICICWSSYVCYSCIENMANRNIINCPVCRRKLKFNLRCKTWKNIKNTFYILLPFIINLVGLIIIPVWFFETFFFNKENTNLQMDYRRANKDNVLVLLCHPTLFLLIMLFNKIIIYPFNIILYKTTAIYYNYPREDILPLDFRSNFSRMYMCGLISYDTLYIIICHSINTFRLTTLHQYIIFSTMFYTVPFLVMALCFIIIGIHNTIVRIQNKIEKYVEYHIQSIHTNTNITREEEVLNRRLEVFNALDNLNEEDNEIDINRIEEEILNDIYEINNEE